MVSLRPDVAHVVVPDAGHDVHLEQRDAWFTSCGGSSTAT